MAELVTMAVVSAATSALGAAQADRRAKAEAQANTNAATQQLQQQAQAAEIEERRRREQLARDRAARLARFGGQGLASGGGSTEAVLGGLAQASARAGADTVAQRNLAMSGSLLDLADRNRLTLLKAADEREKAALNIVGQGATLWAKGKNRL